MDLYAQILLEYNCSKKTTSAVQTPEGIEKIAGFGLPEDYRNYLLNFSRFENHIQNEYVCLWDIDELIELNTGYGIFECLSNTIAIGGNGGGEFIAIEYMDMKSYRVVLSPFIDLDKECHVEIGGSFTDFLVRLDSGLEWFGHIA